MTDESFPTQRATLNLSIGGRQLEAEIEVPAGPTRPRDLLPILQGLTNEVVEVACDQASAEGKAISCRAGCGACCRQLVPLSAAEAHHVAALVEQLPEPRRMEVRRRFDEAERRLAAAGLLERLAKPVLSNEAAISLGLEYFHLGIACPFLEEESCSIHPDRPLACREYLVTSPAENCRQPTAESIDKVNLPVMVSKVLLGLERGIAGPLAPLPLTLAPRWAESHPETSPSRTGPELMNEVLQKIAGRAPGVHSASGAGQSAAQAYDEVPYDSRAYAFTHPSWLAALATLHGMTPPAVDRCRVLELGCASGGNLIPMAFGLPEGRFLGVDLSPRQVGAGWRQIERLGLKNIELQVMDLMEVDRSMGEFDYIVCHGVLSWVPRPVQDKILSICRQNLAPHGVAMVSYNTYPFWHLRGMVREMLLYHIDTAATARERVRQGRQFLDFLAESCAAEKSVYACALQEQAQFWRRSNDDYLRHDPLGEVNEPFYFHDIAARLADRRLQYLGDARFWNRAATLSRDVQRQLNAYRDDVVRYEQYLDFLCEGGFRRSVLCHADVGLNRPQPGALERLWLTSAADPVADEANTKADSALFRSRDGVEVSTSQPWLRAALTVLAQHGPRQFTFDELCRETCRALADAPEARLDPTADPGLLKLPLLECCLNQVVRLDAHHWPDHGRTSDRPHATRLARLQAEASRVITSQRHEQVELSDLERQLLLRLDGRLSQAELIQSMSALIVSGEFTLTPAAGADIVAGPPDLPSLVDDALRRFASLGLLDN